ncbi:DUF2293 domain-containing protein [Neorhizobium galegae]|uniref:DUF2293 domain-containing protein n=1 Tax=Neorhizobium galegae TaxID=399 RepID=UPI002101A13B|nr:DUF2293 domain-containing protein [Neorhizobium galegae]MCQ1571734.1 DUF2293 domain-containing protein [Neorhizobium galegae]
MLLVIPDFPKKFALKGLLVKFAAADVERHIRKKHPGCPDFAVAFFVSEIMKKEWTGLKLGRAVGIIMQTTLRHTMTDYDQMLLVGVDRNEALRRVQPKINAMIASWTTTRKSRA